MVGKIDLLDLLPSCSGPVPLLHPVADLTSSALTTAWLCEDMSVVVFELSWKMVGASLLIDIVMRLSTASGMSSTQWGSLSFDAVYCLRALFFRASERSPFVSFVSCATSKLLW